VVAPVIEGTPLPLGRARGRVLRLPGRTRLVQDPLNGASTAAALCGAAKAIIDEARIQRLRSNIHCQIAISWSVSTLHEQMIMAPSVCAEPPVRRRGLVRLAVP
jgi:hypothetical protein